MLAQLKGLFTPDAVAKALAPLPPLETTVMDSLFKNRPAHPLPTIGVQELQDIVQTVPVVRRDGTPISLEGESVSVQYISPLPVKVKVPVTAAELNDLRVVFGSQVAVSAWRARKVDQIRRAVRDTTEAMCAVVAATGKLTWPVDLGGGVSQTYEVGYGSQLSHTISPLLSSSSTLGDVYAALRAMELKVKQGGLGGTVEFWAGSDVVKVLLSVCQKFMSTAQGKIYSVVLEQGKIMVGNYVIHFMDETYPSPLDRTTWVPKLGAKKLMCVAVNQPGSVWYCAIDSISANNAAVPLHIVPVPRDDDSGTMLIGQAKPLPARPSRATCMATAVA